MILHTLYNTLWTIAPPIIKHYLRKRARQNPDYAQHWQERFGEPHSNPVQHPIWIHAVSVGETRATQPLIAELKKHFPNAPLLLTQMTPTGRATAQALYPDAQCRYLPYDHRDWVRQFLREHRPLFCVLMETEIWVNLIHACHEERIPLFLANARLSPKSQRGYQKIRSLIAPALAQLTDCYAQTPEDAERLNSIGVTHTQVCGNTKYDIAPPKDSQTLAHGFREKIGNRPIFLVASTREKNNIDEAELILKAWQQHRPEALLIIVPRHPERFETAYQLAQQYGFTVQKRSDNQAVRPDTQVWIGDSMGEMFAYYQTADIVFVGGSLVDTGCQNIIEPISCGKPVLFGFSTYNFQSACDNAKTAHAAQQIHSADELVQTVQQWLAHPEQYAHFRDHAQAFIQQHQGASKRIADAIVQKINNTLT